MFRSGQVRSGNPVSSGELLARGYFVVQFVEQILILSSNQIHNSHHPFGAPLFLDTLVYSHKHLTCFPV